MVLWQVYLLAGLLGMVNLFDNPARQTFMIEMVGRDDLPNAVSLNAVVMNASRVVGPAIGGVIITVFGLGICFFVNAASYVAVIIGLAMMRTAELHRTEPVERAKGQVRDGFRYVWRTPALRNVLLSVALIGIFAYNFTVTLALLAKGTFHGGAGAYAVLTSCMGAGAIVGWPDRRPPGPAHAATPPGAGPGLRWPAGRGGARPDTAGGRPADRAHGRGLDRVHRHRQRHAAADRRPGHARSGDGAVRHGLPRDHADRCAVGRGHRPVDQPPGGTDDRCRGHGASAGLLMWRHQAGLRGGMTDAEIHLIEVEAVDDAESRVG